MPRLIGLMPIMCCPDATRPRCRSAVDAGMQRNPAALPAEIQAFMKGNAVPNEVIGALTNDGDPDLLLQVRIRCTAVV